MIPAVRSAIGTIVEALPEPLSLALRPTRYRYDRRARPAPIPVPVQPVKLLIGRANFAAQGHWFARAAEQLPDVGAVSMHVLGPNAKYGFPSDVAVPPDVFQHSPHWRREQFAIVSKNFTHVIIESGRPLFGKLFDHDVVREIKALRDEGVSVALLAHGSEMRRPSRHMLIDEWSPFADGRWPETQSLEKLVDHFQTVIARAGVPVFVTTPELLLDWSPSTLLPLVVDAARWKTPTAPLTSARPRVVHVPSSPYVKGTPLIEPTMIALHQEGVVEYREVHGLQHEEMPGVIGASDILLEQFRTGTYSVAAIEAMAAGRLVVVHLHEQVRQAVRQAAGLEIPIVSATPATLERVLRDVVARPEHYRAIAAQGPAFVAAVHNGRLSAAALAPFLGRGE